MLLRCIWRGEERNCMEKLSMFEHRSTQYGFCCTFNYVRPDSLAQYNFIIAYYFTIFYTQINCIIRAEPDPFYMDETGPELGLILLLNGSLSDYYYPLYNFVGFIVSFMQQKISAIYM